MSAQLRLEIELYLQKTGMSQSEFGRITINDRSLVGQLRKGLTVGARRETKIRAFLDANPAPTGGAIAAQVAVEAARAGAVRQDARRLGGTTKATLPNRRVMTPAETIATMMAQTPADAIQALMRRWPDV